MKELIMREKKLVDTEQFGMQTYNSIHKMELYTIQTGISQEILVNGQVMI